MAKSFKNLQEGKIMFDDKIINTMTDKVNELIEKYNEVCEINENLRNELVSVKAQNEAKSNQILRLEEELKSRNIESEDIYKKIEAVLGK
ncbi:conserved hypothetical protein [Campylobacter upsaliensis RM3195]|uniref:Uncharacterized protein n=4 Tax=Campylobacter TaxID=194 RepID=A0A828QWG7_CAMUP|nr:conserved hypothetical protein [Campylobacter upsaliensis RM3195]EFU72361.1 conserved hypothetical protein [Campylobacter upsaliensis JV21]SUX26945.1 Uncharacterised protein [Campylobacter upsaliensis]